VATAVRSGKGEINRPECLPPPAVSLQRRCAWPFCCPLTLRPSPPPIPLPGTAPGPGPPGSTGVTGAAALFLNAACTSALAASVQAAYAAFIQGHPGVDPATLTVTAACRGTGGALRARAAAPVAAAPGEQPAAAALSDALAGPDPVLSPLEAAAAHATAAESRAPLTPAAAAARAATAWASRREERPPGEGADGGGAAGNVTRSAPAFAVTPLDNSPPRDALSGPAPAGGARRLLGGPYILDVIWGYAGTPHGSLAALRSTQMCCVAAPHPSCRCGVDLALTFWVYYLEPRAGSMDMRACGGNGRGSSAATAPRARPRPGPPLPGLYSAARWPGSGARAERGLPGSGMPGPSAPSPSTPPFYALLQLTALSLTHAKPILTPPPPFTH
jgi:hypothetical protein